MVPIDAGLLAAGLPLVVALGALPAMAGVGVRAAWRCAEAACAAALGLALAAVALATFDGGRVDATTHALGVLVTLLGWVVVRYARCYLAGERGQRRHLAALSFTLASALAVVAADHLALLAAAWVATGIGLRRLLTFHGGRAAAHVAAHKNRLASRLAELCLVVALGLVWMDTGTLSLAGLHADLASGAAPGIALQLAAVLFALAALVQCAQLPLHGWLIQVMEAPTHVSALLHAGVVNLGGVVLIRLAPLIAESLPAQVLLVLAGGITAVLAGLVMMTRVSIKVRLAWSTVAQMGFMLLQCGLGLHALALLHLLAHSVYKAHAFLAAGDTVRLARRAALTPAPRPLSGGKRAAWRLASVPLASGVVAGLAWLGTRHAGLDMPPPIVLWVAALGLAPLLWMVEDHGARALGCALLRVAGVALIGLVVHDLAHTALDAPVRADVPALAALAGGLLLVLYGIQAWVLAFPRGALSRRLHPHVYAGFHLDESFTRFAFRAWPARAPRAAASRPLSEPTGDAA